METCNVCIKGVPKATWIYLKSEAAKSDKSMSEYIDIMAKRDMEKPKGNWEYLMNRKSFLTDEDAKEILRAAAEFRKEFKFR